MLITIIVCLISQVLLYHYVLYLKSGVYVVTYVTVELTFEDYIIYSILMHEGTRKEVHAAFGWIEVA